LRAKEAALLALRAMAEGGIYDHLGGGFHRYSVDEHWSVPHFEKMLYDNGLLLKLYAEVLVSGRALGEPQLTAELTELFAVTVRGTVAYGLREMRSEDGTFFSAQDADSEGEEGKFFVWDPADLERLAREGALSGDEAKLLSERLGVSQGGN